MNGNHCGNISIVAGVKHIERIVEVKMPETLTSSPF